MKGLKKFIQENKKILFLTVVVLICFVIVGFFVRKKEKFQENYNEVIVVEEKKEVLSDTFSRLTFFHTAPLKGSLAIPDFWEGKYRVVESGNKVTFFYIGDLNNIQEIFNIKYYKKEDWEKLDNKDQFLVEKNNWIFSYNKALTNPYNDKNKAIFQKMSDEVDNLLKNFKIFEK